MQQDWPLQQLLPIPCAGRRQLRRLELSGIKNYTYILTIYTICMAADSDRWSLIWSFLYIHMSLVFAQVCTLPLLFLGFTLTFGAATLTLRKLMNHHTLAIEHH